MRALDSLEWIADRPDTAALCRPQERPQHAREKVSVLVRVEVSNRDAGRLQLADLGGGLGLDFVRSQASQQGECAELGDSLAEARIAGAVTATIQQTVDLRLVKQRERRPPGRRGSPLPVEAWIAPDHRLSKAWPLAIKVAEDTTPLFVGLDDGTIHARSETEIVGVDDQAAHAPV